MKHQLRALSALTYDGLIAAMAFVLALQLRYDFNLSEHAEALSWYAVPYGFLTMSVFAAYGLHRSVWRYTAMRDVFSLLQAVTFAMLACGAVIFFLTRLENFPRTAFVILWLLHMAAAAGPRVLMRLWFERKSASTVTQKQGGQIYHALIIGAGNGADRFLREVSRKALKTFHVHGILDDDGSKLKRLMHGVPILGEVITLPAVLDTLQEKGVEIDLLILTEDCYATMEAMISVARTRGIQVKRLPSFDRLNEGESLTNLRPVLIEDLLGRAPVELNMTAIDDMLTNRHVLVTGAGGSIGAELCRQIAQRQPAQLILLDNSEHALYQIDMELNNSFPEMLRQAVMADVRDSERLDAVLQAFPVDTVFHAAAYKHVPMVEANPVSGIENNLFGTICVAEAALRHKVKTMVMVSTDKAVNPTNVMGATKRAAEIYCQNRPQNGSNTRFVTVRFGNVLGSTGSVVPLFTRQIREGGPVTVTHREATRYFMTIPEAVQLILQAATMTKGRDIFMLDMGKPVSIYEMAEEMIRLSGLTPHVDIQIKEIGLRPGEKLYEELWYNDEQMTQTNTDKIFLVQPRPVIWEQLTLQMDALRAACAAQDGLEAVRLLKTIVEEYTPAQNSPFADMLPGKLQTVAKAA